MSATAKKPRPRKIFCSECGKPLWQECTACDGAGEQESTLPRFHCGTMQMGSFCSECGTRLPPKTEQCPLCNGLGWVKDVHVCAAWMDGLPTDPIAGVPRYTDLLRRDSPLGESPPATEQSSGDGLISWIFFVLIVLAIVFVPEFRLFVRGLVLWLWALLQSLIRSLLGS